MRRIAAASRSRLAGHDSHPVRGVFLGALGGIYLIAFSSLGAQVRGLYGRRGIRPICTYLDVLRELPARDRLRRVPTVFWLDATDGTLVFACRAGQVGAVLLALGLAPRATTLALWSLYLSFVSVGREFLSYQWDALLLETGLLAVVVAGKRAEPPPWIVTAALRWLAFRLHFESGHCKLASGDKTWRSGDACCIHFETQPLPTPLGWQVHQLPPRVKRGATYAALALELAVPWLAFAPRRPRRAAFALLAVLQATIAATGNYGFFNVLAVVDNLWLLDDDVLPRPSRVRGVRPTWWRRLGAAIVTLPLVAISASLLAARLTRRAPRPGLIARLHDALAPLHAVSSYGLFAVMTTSRPEIVIEGSDDGVHWHEYEFRYKAGDLRRPPRWIAPHQPRLDWQMWFAALGPAPRWFLRFVQRLLEGSPDVLALLAHDPFAGRAPRYVRALLYDYRMTDRETRRRTGAWWKRELYGTYLPALELPRADERTPRVSRDRAARA